MAFIAFTLLILIGSNAWLAWRGYKKELALAEESSRNLTHALSQQFDAVLSDIDRTLENITFRIEQDDASRENIGKLQPELVNTLSRSEHLQSIFILDSNGQTIVSTDPEIPSNIKHADQAYFSAHTHSPSSATLISGPMKGPSSGTWVIPVSRRLNSPAGAFDGVVVASLRVDYVRKVLDGFSIGDQGAAALTLADGTILARRPFAEEDMGRVIKNPQIRDMLLHSRAGTIRMRSPVDGVQRLLGIEFTQNHRVIVTVARAESEVLHNWWRALAIQALTIAILSALIAISGRYVVQVIKLRDVALLEREAAHQQVMDMNQRLQYLSEHDALTGLLNRRAFDSRASVAMASGMRYQRKLSIILFDVDHFKAYNDGFGHQAGDDCLKAVARALSSTARRPGDVVARYGGEEFIMLLPETDAGGARVIAANALQAVRALNLPHAGSPQGSVTVSAGGVTADFAHPTEEPITELIHQADSALYAAKRAGRDTYRDFG